MIEVGPRAPFTVITHGTLAVGEGEHPDRLLKIYKGLKKIVDETKPSVLSVERVFFAKNAASALKLGQARGVVLLLGAQHELHIEEFTPTQVKASVSGTGKADKEQVEKAVQWWVGKQKFASSDASDAVALAVTAALTGGSSGGARNSIPNGASHSRSNAVLQSRSRKKLSIAESVGITDQRLDSGKGKYK